MKTIRFSVTGLCLALLAVSCSNLNTRMDLDDGQFYAYDFTTSSYYTINTVLLAQNSVCQVYADVQAGISASTGENIAATFKNAIYNQITESFGSPIGINGNNQIILLLLDIRDGYSRTAGGGYIAGYFDPDDLFQNHAYSNLGELLYLDVNPGTPGDSEFYSTIAHEFQHLINYSVSLTTRKNGLYFYPQDTWINEGLSTAAEYIYGGSQTSRVSYFNADPMGTIAKGNNFFVWQEDDSVLDEYATAYLFFQWLRIHSSKGTGIYKDIVYSPYYDYQAVTQAAGTQINAEFSSWTALIRQWLLANYVNASSGTLGYNGEIQTRTAAVSAASILLAPGEGVFSGIPAGGSFTPPGTDSSIAYAGITKTGTISGTGAYTGDRLLTFNKNSQAYIHHNGTAEIDTGSYGTGYLTGHGDAARTARSAYSIPFRYPVDPRGLNSQKGIQSGQAIPLPARE
ncbi:hypothetical protein [Breznakiella homolactica]|uniref:Neutral metalloprotease n=1 Tax=Breznakiella homolactica TaxID=2798577 RepID=A0A7T7XQ63_9SPIR|nr:hypothetical protein [Breznakiella homolactica]QQO10470.1 hypothetical protein JFL75_06025 [Breznakiella homolactica]